MNYLNIKLETTLPVIKNIETLVMQLNNPKQAASIKEKGKSAFIYNRKSGKSEKFNSITYSFITAVNKYVNLYLIDAVSKIQINQEGKIFTDWGEIGLKISYMVQITPGAETSAVSFLAARDTPAQLLSQNLYNWSTEQINKICSNLFSDEDLFCKQIQDYIGAKGTANGLNITTEVNYHAIPDSEVTHQSIDISENNIDVQPAGYTSFVPVNYSTTLLQPGESAPGLFFQLLYSRKEEIKHMLNGWLQDYIRSKVSYHEMCNHLNGSVRGGIIAKWNEKLTSSGIPLQVGDLKVKSNTEFETEVSFGLSVENIFVSNGIVDLEAKLIISVSDEVAGSSGIADNVNELLRQKLKKNIQKIAVGYSVAGLIANVKQFTEAVKAPLNDDIKLNGYTVMHLLIMIKGADNTFNAINLTLQDDMATYQIRIGDTLSIIMKISGKINSFDHEYWHENMTKVDRPDLMITDEIRSEIAGKILELDPDEFYTKLVSGFSGDLKISILGFLKKKLNFDNLTTVHIVSISSELLDRIKALSQGSHSAKMKLLNENVEFLVKFSILDKIPDNMWDLFSGRKYNGGAAEEIQNIIEDFESSLRYILTPIVTPAKIKSTNLSDFIRENTAAAVKEVKRKRFVDLFVEDVVITKNNLTDLATDVIIQREIIYLKNLQEQQGKLLEDLRNAKESDMSAGYIEDIKIKLNQVEAELKVLDIQSDNNNFIAIPENNG